MNESDLMNDRIDDPMGEGQTIEGERGLAIVPSPQMSDGMAGMAGLPAVHGGYDVHLEHLKVRPKSVKGIIKSRVGRGGKPVRYVGWENTADVFDESFGPGMWSNSLYRLNQTPRIDTDKSGNNRTKTEVTAWCKFRGMGLPYEVDVFGHGFLYSDDPEASLADAIESAMSRALTKAGARLSKYLRSVWNQDDEAIKHLENASQTEINAAMMMISMIEDRAKSKPEVGEALQKLYEEYGLRGKGEFTPSNLTSGQVNEFNRKAGGLAVG